MSIIDFSDTVGLSISSNSIRSGYIYFGTSKWTPAQVTTSLWLDGQDSSTFSLIGSQVSSWQDKSGNNDHLTQSVSNSQPMRISNGVDFNGTSHFLSLVDGNPTLSGTDLYSNDLDQFTVFVVGQGGSGSSFQEAAGRGAVLIAKGGGLGASGTYALGLMTHNGLNQTVTPPKWIVEQRGWTGSNTNAIFNSNVRATGSLNTTSLIAHRWNGSKNKAELNGSNFDLEVGAPFTKTNQNANLMIGGVGGATPNVYGDSIVNEVIVFNSAISDELFNIVNGYLAHKWGLEGSLPSSHPYKSNAPVV